MNLAKVLLSISARTLPIFVIPMLGLIFAMHVNSSWDEEYRTLVLKDVAADTTLQDDVKAEAQAFWMEASVAGICADPSARVDVFGEGSGVCDNYDWIRYLSWSCLLSLILGALTIAVLVGSAIFLFTARALQYPALIIGWNAVRFTGALQLLVQGAILVLLSFWVTAFFFQSYYVKIIVVIGILAALAVFAALSAIFHRPDDSWEVEGHLLKKENAPTLWTHLEQRCAALEIEAPTHVVAGIDDNFFVTEHSMTVNGEHLEGRTLYVSLPLLRRMAREEADAIFCHEMAHFSGGDTRYSRKISPTLGRYSVFLQYLGEQPTAWPVYQLALGYRLMMELALSRASRQREERADQIAAEQTSADAASRALIKVMAHSAFRAQVENVLFAADEEHENIDVEERWRTGFLDFATSSAFVGALNTHDAPHPFDSHPNLLERLKVLAPIAERDWSAVVQNTPESNWCDTIEGADAIERNQWERYNTRFSEAHELKLAWSYLPNGEDERSIVEKHFPACSFALKKGDVEVELNFESVHAPDWGDVLRFDEVKELKRIDGIGGDILRFAKIGKGHEDIKLRKMANADSFVAILGNYYARAQNAAGLLGDDAT